jgi:hypothetical protein
MVLWLLFVGLVLLQAAAAVLVSSVMLSHPAVSNNCELGVAASTLGRSWSSPLQMSTVLSMRRRLQARGKMTMCQHISSMGLSGRCGTARIPLLEIRTRGLAFY